MKLLHVVPSYLPAVRYGGPIYSVHGLCRALLGLGHEVHVFTTSVDGDGDSDVILGEPVDLDGVKVWYFPSKKMRRLYYAPAMMRELKRQVRDFDIVHLHSVFLWPTWAAARVAYSAGVPYVLSPRGMLVKDLIQRKSRLLKTAWIFCIETKNIEKAAAIHVTSGLEAENLRKFGFHLPAVWNIPNGIDMPQVWSEDSLSEDVRKVVRQDVYVLFFGRINWKKGLDRLVKAWKQLPGSRLVIAGNDEDGYVEELESLARDCGVRDDIVFLARSVTGADKEALFAAACLFVLPSYSENFGNTVLEAMVRGIPVVVTEEVGAAEVVRESSGGVVVAGEPASLGNAIEDLVASPERRKLMGDTARNAVAERYSWAVVAKSMEKEYQKVLGG